MGVKTDPKGDESGNMPTNKSLIAFKILDWANGLV
jgi:hypothetical protein